MDKALWIVTGNKGGVGKSAVAKALVEWLEAGAITVTVMDGDSRTSDVAGTFKHRLTVHTFDLQDEGQWPMLADEVCQIQDERHIVINMPDGLTERMLAMLGRTTELTSQYGWDAKTLFVVNTLPDGLHMLPMLEDVVPAVVTVKNLCFGRPRSFTHFDSTYGDTRVGQVVLFPAMTGRVMTAVRESGLSFDEFVKQRGADASNFAYGKIVVADWNQAVSEAFDEILTEV